MISNLHKTLLATIIIFILQQPNYKDNSPCLHNCNANYLHVAPINQGMIEMISINVGIGREWGSSKAFVFIYFLLSHDHLGHYNIILFDLRPI